MSNESLIIPPPFDAERDDWGAKVLAEWAEAQIGAYPRVLVVGAGAGGVGLPLARAGARLTFADDSVSALAAARATFARARLPAAFHASPELPPGLECDLALINILWWSDGERGRELIALAAAHVRPGGAVALGGGKKAGIQGAEQDLRELVGPTSAPLYRKGHRVVVALRPADWRPPSPAPPISRDLAIRGQELTVRGAPGVFAGGALDPATAMLLASLELAPDAAALDLGCGAGIIGMLAARLAPRGAATLVDANALAVALAGRNLAANGIANARALASDGVAAVRDQRFDAVITNPPFHQGRVQSDAVARRFIREAREVLAPGGAFWLVANRFLRYEPVLAESFASVSEVAGDTRFKVLRASL